jgi:sigma-B regulation protein RsbU (phosphoserine phosphatase)
VERGVELFVVLGDVAGKGPVAAATTALVRDALRAATHLERDPVALAALVNELLLEQGGDPPPMCTLALLVVRRAPGGLRVRCVRAGHPPPLLVRADGATDWVEPPGALLGAIDDPGVVACDIALGPGDGLVLYTDGLTEADAPSRLLDDETLARGVAVAAGTGALPLLESARALAGGKAGLRDDVALLALAVPARRP